MKKVLVFAIVASVMWISPLGVHATNYYVDATNGSLTGNGLSDATAWKTIGQVNSYTFQTGDDVFFKCGGTWYTRTDAKLKIDWSGTGNDNRVVVGAYYMDGSETIGVNVDGKPIIDGGWDLETFESAGRQFEIQVNPEGINYATIQDLHIRNSHGYGIYNGYQTPSSIGYITFRNILVEDTGRAGIATFYMGNNVVVEYCKVMRDNIQFFIGESTNWGGGIRIKGNYSIGRYNEVGAGWGEGINVSPTQNSIYQLIENNLVWGRQSVGIYLGRGAQDATVRNNVVIGTTNTDYHKPWVYGGRTWNPTGIGFNQEGEGGFHTLRNRVYNNVVIGCSVGINSINKSGETVGYDNRQLVYNNTFIDNYYNINTHVSELMDTEYRNNLSVIHDDAAAVGSKHIWHNSNMGTCYIPLGNFWSSEPELSGWSHPDDVIGDAKLFKTSGWQNISIPSDIDIAQAFALTQGSDAIDTAQSLGNDYADGFAIGTDFNTPDASDYNTPIVVELVDQNDYYGWDFGAFVYTGVVPDPCCGDGSCNGTETCLTCPEDCGECLGLIPQTDWDLLFVDSEEMGDVDRPATNSYDGDPDTFWHTEWSLPTPDPCHPHEIQIDLGGFYDICGFHYLPRQDEGPGGENGMIKDYEFYVSSDKDDWGSVVASGTWTAGKMEKQVSFDRVLGQYVRLVAMSEVNDNPWTTMAELNVLAVQPDSDINDDGKVNIEGFAVLLVWWDDEDACLSPGWCGGADLDMSGTVDFTDLTYFVENWLRQAD